MPPTTGGPDPSTTILSDLAPVPGTGDFYLTTTGDRATPPTPGDTCFFFANATRTFHRTGLRTQLPPVAPAAVGPLDPAYSVVVDPSEPSVVYVGTVSGVWRGVRPGAPGAHAWTPEVNGLPEAAVQDLSIWADPAGAASSTRLLRAALQSRGVWEVNLAADEPERTYIRVHPRDDRRRIPTPMANPRRKPGAPNEPAFASPDIVVRPRANPATAPAWRFKAGDRIDLFNATDTDFPYQVWTFQTAFRWHFPSITADGTFRSDFANLVQLYRSTNSALGPATQEINKALWDDVVGGTHLNSAGSVTSNASDPLAVYRAPWHTPAAMQALATELDLVEKVRVPKVVAKVQHVFSEPSTVDVLVHHRDTRPVPLGDAFVVLLWHSAPSQAAVLSASVATIPAYVTSVINGGPPAPPAPWKLASTAVGGAMHPLSAQLDARMPRAIPIDVNLSDVTSGHHVLFLAIVGSTVDPCNVAPLPVTTTPPPPPSPATPVGLVQRWPYAALRLVRVFKRPV